jgi:hypothetical protein
MKRHLGFVHIKKFSNRKTSLRADSLIVVREVGAARDLGADLEPRISFHASNSFPSNKSGRVSRGIRVRRQSQGSSTRKDPCTDTSLWNIVSFGCNPKNYVPTITYWLSSFNLFCGRCRLAPPQRSPHPARPRDPTNASRAQRGETVGHFPRIGVLSAQRNSDIVSSQLPLKDRSSSHEEEYVP